MLTLTPCHHCHLPSLSSCNTNSNDVMATMTNTAMHHTFSLTHWHQHWYHVTTPPPWCPHDNNSTTAPGAPPVPLKQWWWWCHVTTTTTTARWQWHHVITIGIASSDQVQRQQQRDEPVRENTHLVLDTLASRLRELSLNCRSWELSILGHKDPA